MIGGDGKRFVFGRHDNGSACQMVGFSEQPTGALVDGGDRRLIEDAVRNAADAKMMQKIFVHLGARFPFKMAAGHDP